MSTDIVPVDDLKNLYPSLGDPDMMEALASNLDGDDVGVFDLDRITVPPGAGTMWNVPGLDGMEAAKSLRGIIIGIIGRRSYWLLSLDEQSEPSPPDCASDDAKTGRGLYGVGSDLHPTGDCASCPMNQFQEVKGRTTKPCGEQRLVLFLREGTLLPVVIQLSPTSMKEMKKHQLRMAGQGVPYYTAITELELRKVEASPAYSVVVPSMKGRIDRDQAKELKVFGDKVVAAYNAAAAAGVTAARAEAENDDGAAADGPVDATGSEVKGSKAAAAKPA